MSSTGETPTNAGQDESGRTFSAGGYVEGPSLMVRLDDDECVLDRDGACGRTDERHGWRWADVTALCDREPRYVKVGCMHLARHVVPVESGGEVVARLCLTCDQQLLP